MDEIYNVYKNGELVKMTYAEICRDLGFHPEFAYVDITTSGSITFTCGKLDEAKSLAEACRQNGYKVSKRLAATIRR